MDASENSMGGVGVGAELILSHPLNIFTKLWNLWETLPATMGLVGSLTSRDHAAGKEEKGVACTQGLNTDRHPVRTLSTPRSRSTTFISLTAESL